MARASRKYAQLNEVAAASNPKILIVACHWIGDTLWAAQVVPHLRKRWPGACISVITKSISTPLWRGELAVDEIINGDSVVSDRRREHVDMRAMKRLAAKLAGQKWDIAIDLTGNRYSAILCHRLHARHTVGFDGGEFGGLYATYVRDAEQPGVHLSQRPFRVVQPLLGQFACAGKIIPPKPATDYQQAYRNFGLDSARPVIVIAPGAGWSKKCWGPRNFSEVAAILLGTERQVVLTGSPAELKLSQKILASIDESLRPSVCLVHKKNA